MAHGQPDFGMYSQKSITYGLSDMAELAVRLRSPVIFDRRGDVIVIEDFSYGLNSWYIAAAPTGSSITVTNKYTRAGGFSADVATGTDSDGSKSMARWFGYPRLSSVGIEMSFLLSSLIANVQLYLYMYDGSELNQFSANYNHATGKLTIVTSTGAWEETDHDQILYDTDPCWHTIKIVGNTVTNKYKRILLDNFEQDLSAYGCYAAANASRPCMEVAIQIFPTSLAVRHCYITDLIITQNEP